MKSRLLMTVAVLGIVGFSLPVNAGVIAGVTGSSVRAGTFTQVFYKLGTGLTGDLDSVYVTVNDNGQTGYLTNFQLAECSAADYATGCNGGTYGTTGLYWAVSSVGGSNYRTVALSGSAKRTVRLDFSIHTTPNCNPGVNCTGTAGSIPLDPTKFYAVHYQASQNADGTGASRQIYVYGISVELTDASGNAEYCGTAYAGTTRCSVGVLGTPYFLFTDAALTSSELSNFGGFATISFDWPIPTGFPIAPGASYGLTSSGSLTGQDLGYFGNMLRDLAVWLFSPWDESTANAWSNFRNSMTVHIPFSYLTETNAMIQAATVASGSIPTWNYYSPVTGSVSFFSSSTITGYAPSGFLTLLRTLVAVALWLMLLWYVYGTIQSLWR